MRHLHPVQVHKHTTAFAGAGATYTVALDEPCAAGSRVIVCAAGGAQTAIRFTDGSGTLFTRRAQALSAMDTSIHDAVAVGGETALHVTLNGDETVVLEVHHTDAGAFIAASSGTPTSAADFHCAPDTAVTVTGSAVLFGVWGVVASTPADGTWSFRQMGPLGALYSNEGHQPGAGTKIIYATGVADVTAAGRWPVTGSAGAYKATSVWVADNSTVHVAQAAYADASGVATNPAPANPVVAENSLPGTFRDNWFGGSNASNATIAGYTNKTSYAPGETVEFKVDSSGNPWRAEVYRLGFYGWESFAARLVTSHITGTVETQPAPAVDPVLGSTSCAWTTNATWTVPADATPGLYYFLVRRTDATSNFASGHFVVRGASVTGRTAVVLPDCTYQAYNLWGATTDNGPRFSPGVWSGRSLYAYGPDASNLNAHRAYAVSFDRPYSCQSTQTNTYIFDSDAPWIVWAEAQGYDLTYLSDVDLDVDPSRLTTAAQVVMLGHHEYWTTSIYDAFRNTQAAGVSMLVNGSNIALWRVRFAAGDTGRRTVICYKESLTRDEGPGFTGTGYDPVEWTGTWRDAGSANGRANPDVRRENQLTGQMFVLSAPVTARYGVPYASRTAPVWRGNAGVQALSSGGTWLAPAGSIGDEADAADGSDGQPENLVNLCPTTISGSTGPNAAGTLYSTSVSPTAGWTLHRHGSGALVANTGSWRAGQGLSRWAQSSYNSVVTAPSVDWQSSWLALCYDLGMVPATRTSLRPGLDAEPVDPATGAPGPGRDAVARAYGLDVPGGAGMLLFFLGA